MRSSHFLTLRNLSKKKKKLQQQQKNQSGEMHPTGWRCMFQSTHRRSHANHKNIFYRHPRHGQEMRIGLQPYRVLQSARMYFFFPHPDIPSCQINLMPAASGNNHPHSSKKRNKATVHRVCRPATHSHTHTHTQREGGGEVVSGGKGIDQRRRQGRRKDRCDSSENLGCSFLVPAREQVDR